MSRMRRFGLAAVFLGLALSVQAQNSAQAQEFGAMSCEELWYARNELYKEAGFCFRTARAISAFGNAGCLYDDMGSVPLSPGARRSVAAIQTWERRRACPR